MVSQVVNRLCPIGCCFGLDSRIHEDEKEEEEGVQKEEKKAGASRHNDELVQLTESELWIDGWMFWNKRSCIRTQQYCDSAFL